MPSEIKSVKSKKKKKKRIHKKNRTPFKLSITRVASPFIHKNSQIVTMVPNHRKLRKID